MYIEFSRACYQYFGAVSCVVLIKDKILIMNILRMTPVAAAKVAAINLIVKDKYFRQQESR